MARSWAIGTASTVWARSSANTSRASRSTPGGRGALPDPDRDHAGGHQQDVAALDVLVPPAVDPLGVGEPGVPGVDQLGELALAHPGRHRQRGDRDPVAHPDRGVAGEQQVGQRVDQEVVVGEQRGDQAVPAAHLVVAHARGERLHQAIAGRGRSAPCGSSRAGCRRDGVTWSPPRSRWPGRPPPRASPPAARSGRAPRRRGRAAPPRTRRAPPAPGSPTGCRRRAACRCCAGSAASARCRDGAASPCAAVRPRWRPEGWS